MSLIRASAARSVGAALTLCSFAAGVAMAQDRLPSMPGYEQWARMSPQIAQAIPGRAFGRGGGGTRWSPDSKTVDFSNNGKQYRYDLTAHKLGDVPATPPTQTGRGGRGGGIGVPERGRQFDAAIAPTGNHRAIYRDRNVWIGDSTGANAVQITSDGSEKSRVKYGTASWVYGEELSQRTAMWWSPDGSKLAFYRFDESKVPDFYLATRLTGIQDTLDVEAYPKPGVPNPVVDLFIYDVNTKQTTKVDVRDGKPFENATLGYYVYAVDWSPDSKELYFLRTNRRQNALEMAACVPSSGKCRVVIHDEWPSGWIDTDPAPEIRWLKDGNRFVWESDRTGFKNYYLYDFKAGKLINPITRLNAEVADVVRIDEASNTLWYMGRDGKDATATPKNSYNYMKLQLHRVKLDGTDDVRVTDPTMTHTVSLSPDGKYFVDVAETHDRAPETQLVDANGKIIDQLGKTDLTKFESLGLKKVEMYDYATRDGQAMLHGMIHYPSNFDSTKKYPVLVTVYGGPGVPNATSERFALPNPLTEFGFIVVNVEARTNPGMGRKYLDAVYLKLGITEIDDMADGIKALWPRRYIDKNRVGIFGTSYGGYTSVMELLRYPDVFAAASSSSPPTDWRNYDTIYTERYMWLPQENPEGYARSSAMTYAKDLKGRLMLYFGTADNNVHPSNMMQLIQALQQNGKSFELQAGPDQGHSGLNMQRMMEFFIENLVLNPGKPKA